MPFKRPSLGWWCLLDRNKHLLATAPAVTWCLGVSSGWPNHTKYPLPPPPSTFGWHRAAGNAMSPLERLALVATCLSQGVVCPFLAPSILRFACLSACLSFTPSLRLCGAVPVLTSRWPPGSQRGELKAEGHDNTSIETGRCGVGIIGYYCTRCVRLCK